MICFWHSSSVSRSCLLFGLFIILFVWPCPLGRLSSMWWSLQRHRWIILMDSCEFYPTHTSRRHLLFIVSLSAMLMCALATSVAPAQSSSAPNATATTQNPVDSIPCWPGCICEADGSSRTCEGPQPWDQFGPPIRDDGRCGLPEFNYADCYSLGPWGRCCSSHGWCGNSTDHCGAGCLNGCR